MTDTTEGSAQETFISHLVELRDRLLAAIAHGDADRDWAVLAREQARTAGLE